MFNNLVESGSHRRDLARKGRFMLGTLALYGVLLAASGVASVVAYDARLERQTLEITSMIAPVPFERPPTEPTAEIERPRPPAGSEDRVAIRTVFYNDLRTTPRTPPPVSTGAVNVPPVPPGMHVTLGNRNYTPEGNVGPRGDGDGDLVPRERAVAPVRVVATVDPTPPPASTPAPTPAPPQTLRVTSKLISSKVISKPVPPYPAVAKAAGVSGSVNVEILIGEDGQVITARAIDGPALLRPAAVQAARQARFTPTVLGGRPVKVSGVIMYNFVLQ